MEKNINFLTQTTPNYLTKETVELFKSRVFNETLCDLWMLNFNFTGDGMYCLCEIPTADNGYIYEVFQLNGKKTENTKIFASIELAFEEMAKYLLWHNIEQETINKIKTIFHEALNEDKIKSSKKRQHTPKISN